MSDVVDSRIEERVGSVLSEKWTLERLLGTGGMAAVYLARHRNGAKAAVKILHPEIARHAQVRERFLREGYAANKVEHRGTAQVLDDDVVKEGPDAGAAYIVMELLEGESVDEKFDRGHVFTEREILELLAAVLDVLAAAHDRGVIHRDLKPDNLFLARDPDSGATRLKVLDFGLARIAEVESVTVDGLALGTPHYMPPEQAAGSKDEIDARTDIFALGATAFFLIARRHVHEAETVLQTVVKMGKDPAPPLRSVAPNVSEATARIIDRALQFSKADRYPTAAAMRVDVDKALADLAGGDATIELFAPSRRSVPVAPAAEPAPPPLPLPPEEKKDTISLSLSDLEPVVEPVISPTAPAPVANDEPRPSTRETVMEPRPSTRETANMKAADELVALSRKSRADEDPRPSSRETAKLPPEPAPEPVPAPAIEPEEVIEKPAVKKEPEPEPVRGFPWIKLTVFTVGLAALIVMWPDIRARFGGAIEPVLADAGIVTTTEADASSSSSSTGDASLLEIPDAENLLTPPEEDDDDAGAPLPIVERDASITPAAPATTSAPHPTWHPPAPTAPTTKKPPTKPPHPKPPGTKKK